MSICRVFPCVIGRGCLLWPVRSLGKTLLAFALFHSVLQGKFTLFPRYFLTSYFFIPIPKKGSTKECSNYCTIALISHASKVMPKILQARLQQYWLGHRLGLLGYLDYWMVFLGNKQRSFCHFWDCIQVLQKSKMAVWGGLINSCEKKRSKKQRRKGNSECRVPKNSKKR